MKKIALFVSFFSVFALVLAGGFAKNVPQIQAWFGAGMTPGWPPMTNGLKGQIALPVYKFSPDFYTVGNTVSLNVQGFNTSTSPITDHFWLVINHVTQAPIGTDISNGQPTTPGLNENQLYAFHNANNDVQQNVFKGDLGSQTFPASGSATFGGSYTTTQPGYYQFDFLDIDPNGPYSGGHILAAGFFRVLAPVTSPSPSPTATPSATPTPTPSPSPTPSPTPSVTPSPSPSPTPSPSPSTGGTSPTATPSPAPGPSSSLGKDGPTCSNSAFTATMDLRDSNNNPVPGVTVTFVYRGDTRTTTTNSNGRAQTTYTYTADDSVYASANGYPSQALFVSAAQGCPAGSSSSSSSSSNGSNGGTVLGASTTINDPGRGGEVLGASTLADTGTDYASLFYYGAAAVLTVIGAAGTTLSRKRA